MLKKTLILLALVAAAPVAMAADVGQIKTAKGGVVIVRAGQEVAATPGTAIQQSDRVVTKADGSAGIAFKDNSLLSLGPDSSLDISLFSFGAKDQADAAKQAKGPRVFLGLQ